MVLSPHFTIDEMVRTEVRRLQEVNRAEAEGHVAALRSLCETLLEPLRAHFAAPVFVHSGFRCAALNAAIDGSKTSQHLKGEAADLSIAACRLEDAWKWIWKDSGLRWGQCILEGWVSGRPQWLHFSLGPPWRPLDRSGEVMTWDAKRGYVLVDRVRFSPDDRGVPPRGE